MFVNKKLVDETLFFNSVNHGIYDYKMPKAEIEEINLKGITEELMEYLIYDLIAKQKKYVANFVILSPFFLKESMNKRKKESFFSNNIITKKYVLVPFYDKDSQSWSMAIFHNIYMNYPLDIYCQHVTNFIKENGINNKEVMLLISEAIINRKEGIAKEIVKLLETFLNYNNDRSNDLFDYKILPMYFNQNDNSGKVVLTYIQEMLKGGNVDQYIITFEAESKIEKGFDMNYQLDPSLLSKYENRLKINEEMDSYKRENNKGLLPDTFDPFQVKMKFNPMPKSQTNNNLFHKKVLKDKGVVQEQNQEQSQKDTLQKNKTPSKEDLTTFCLSYGPLNNSLSASPVRKKKVEGSIQLNSGNTKKSTSIIQDSNQIKQAMNLQENNSSNNSLLQMSNSQVSIVNNSIDINNSHENISIANPLVQSQNVYHTMSPIKSLKHTINPHYFNTDIKIPNKPIKERLQLEQLIRMNLKAKKDFNMKPIILNQSQEANISLENKIALQSKTIDSSNDYALSQMMNLSQDMGKMLKHSGSGSYIKAKITQGKLHEKKLDNLNTNPAIQIKRSNHQIVRPPIIIDLKKNKVTPKNRYDNDSMENYENIADQTNDLNLYDISPFIPRQYNQKEIHCGQEQQQNNKGVNKNVRYSVENDNKIHPAESYSTPRYKKDSLPLQDKERNNKMSESREFMANPAEDLIDQNNNMNNNKREIKQVHIKIGVGAASPVSKMQQQQKDEDNNIVHTSLNAQQYKRNRKNNEDLLKFPLNQINNTPFTQKVSDQTLLITQDKEYNTKSKYENHNADNDTKPLGPQKENIDKSIADKSITNNFNTRNNSSSNQEKFSSDNNFERINPSTIIRDEELVESTNYPLTNMCQELQEEQIEDDNHSELQQKEKGQQPEAISNIQDTLLLDLDKNNADTYDDIQKLIKKPSKQFVSKISQEKRQINNQSKEELLAKKSKEDSMKDSFDMVIEKRHLKNDNNVLLMQNASKQIINNEPIDIISNIIKTSEESAIRFKNSEESLSLIRNTSDSLKSIKNTEELSQPIKYIEELSDSIRNREESTKPIKYIEDLTKPIQYIQESSQLIKNIDDSPHYIKNIRESSKPIKNTEQSIKPFKDIEDSSAQFKDSQDKLKEHKDISIIIEKNEDPSKLIQKNNENLKPKKINNYMPSNDLSKSIEMNDNFIKEIEKNKDLSLKLTSQNEDIPLKDLSNKITKPSQLQTINNNKEEEHISQIPSCKKIKEDIEQKSDIFNKDYPEKKGREHTDIFKFGDPSNESNQRKYKTEAEPITIIEDRNIDSIKADKAQETSSNIIEDKLIERSYINNAMKKQKELIEENQRKIFDEDIKENNNKEIKVNKIKEREDIEAQNEQNEIDDVEQLLIEQPLQLHKKKENKTKSNNEYSIRPFKQTPQKVMISKNKKEEEDTLKDTSKELPKDNIILTNDCKAKPHNLANKKNPYQNTEDIKYQEAIKPFIQGKTSSKLYNNQEKDIIQEETNEPSKLATTNQYYESTVSKSDLSGNLSKITHNQDNESIKNNSTSKKIIEKHKSLANKAESKNSNMIDQAKSNIPHEDNQINYIQISNEIPIVPDTPAETQSHSLSHNEDKQSNKSSDNNIENPARNNRKEKSPTIISNRSQEDIQDKRVNAIDYDNEDNNQEDSKGSPTNSNQHLPCSIQFEEETCFMPTGEDTNLEEVNEKISPKRPTKVNIKLQMESQVCDNNNKRLIIEDYYLKDTQYKKDTQLPYSIEGKVDLKNLSKSNEEDYICVDPKIKYDFRGKSTEQNNEQKDNQENDDNNNKVNIDNTIFNNKYNAKNNQFQTSSKGLENIHKIIKSSTFNNDYNIKDKSPSDYCLNRSLSQNYLEIRSIRMNHTDNWMVADLYDITKAIKLSHHHHPHPKSLNTFDSILPKKTENNELLKANYSSSQEQDNQLISENYTSTITKKHITKKTTYEDKKLSFNSITLTGEPQQDTIAKIKTNNQQYSAKKKTLIQNQDYIFAQKLALKPLLNQNDVEDMIISTHDNNGKKYEHIKCPTKLTKTKAQRQQRCDFTYDSTYNAAPMYENDNKDKRNTYFSTINPLKKKNKNYFNSGIIDNIMPRNTAVAIVTLPKKRLEEIDDEEETSQIDNQKHLHGLSGCGESFDNCANGCGGKQNPNCVIF